MPSAVTRTLLKAVVPEMQQSLQVKYGNQNSNLSIVGTTADYVEVKNYTVPFGRMFTAGDDEARQRYAVLGVLGSAHAWRQPGAR